ncbi:phage resistance protein [Nocardiopsis sp. NPDC006938]|uniref:phage resistance protein n=1 Tax=Nocardiopsis sp. NPDC006938 TaxID=3364337 RepID=UPI0036AF10C8
MTTPSPGSSGTGRVISDLIDIPLAVQDGDLVVKLTESTSTRQAQALAEYVVTPQLAESFDQALETIRSSVTDGKSQAAYLHGSFGAGKSHFLAVLSAILDHHPDARSKPGLADLLAKHDSWLSGKKFIEVKAHLVEKDVSIEANILGGYVRQVRHEYPDAPVPAVYRADGLLEDAREQRARTGDEAFIDLLPSRGDSAEGESDDVWGELAGPSTWSTETLDAAFAVHPDTEVATEQGLRQELISALISGPFKRYTSAVGDSSGAYVSIDEGLSVISRHAKKHLGCDAVVLLLDELILRFTAFIGDEGRISSEVQKIAKLVESSHSHRPAPIISFVPRQRDLRELVGLGGGTEGISQTISYWDGRFGHIKLADANLTEIARHRLIKPRSDEAAAEIDAAFERMRGSRAEVRDTLLDSAGGADTSTWEDFRSLYPFSPAALHVLVEMSYALQRQRSAIKLLLELLVKYRTTLPVGQMVPIGAVFDVLIEGEAKPFKDHLSAEYAKISNFYLNKVQPWLLEKHEVTKAEVAGLDVRSPFRRDDLLVKTLLLSALTPNVPALKDLTVGRAMALNQGIVKARRPGQDVKAATTFFQDMAAQFGEVRVGAQSDNPTLSLNLLRVDTESLMRSAYSAANDHALRRLFKRLLWQQFGLEPGAERAGVVWRGTQRSVELVFGNVRSTDDLGREEFRPVATNAVRVVIDYPFDDGDHSPSEDRYRVQALREEFGETVPGLVWLPTFLSPGKLEDARRILMMEYLLEPNVIEEKAPDWSSDDRREARAQLDNQRNQLTTQIGNLLRGAYGLVEVERDSSDYGAPADPHIEPMPQGLNIPLEAGSQFPAALERITTKLLDHLYPEHPDLASPTKKSALRRGDLSIVLKAVEEAKADRLNRYENAPKSDLPTLRHIAGPLRIATVGEVFVLRDDWQREIDRFVKVNMPTSTDVRVGDLKKWIRAREDGQGLPEDIVDLLVLVYAVQSDRAWIRAGKRYTGAEIGQLADDIVLRRQELPSEEDFQRANERAQRIFGLPAQPLLNSRSVQRMAEQLKEQAHRLQAGSEHLVRELTKHTQVLGLNDEAPRLRTARASDELLGRLSGLADDTELVRALGQADLPEESGVYHLSITGAGNLAQALAAARWDLLEALETIIQSGGKHSTRAEQILGALREAARHNESSQKLANALSSANSAASALNNLIIREASGGQGTPPGTQPGGGTVPEHTGVTGGAGPTLPQPPATSAGAWATVDPGVGVDVAVAELRTRLGIPEDRKIQITIREAE